MTLLIMTILITLNTCDVTCNDITCIIHKCNITYMFLSTVVSKVQVKSVISKVVIRKVFISVVVKSMDNYNFPSFAPSKLKRCQSKQNLVEICIKKLQRFIPTPSSIRYGLTANTYDFKHYIIRQQLSFYWCRVLGQTGEHLLKGKAQYS